MNFLEKFESWILLKEEKEMPGDFLEFQKRNSMKSNSREN